MSSAIKKSYAAEKNKGPVRVIKGKKLERRRRLRILAGSLAAVAIALSALHFYLPTGISETFGNLAATIGAGSYPIELYGNETLTLEQNSSYYSVLTDSHITAFSKGGKRIFSEAHGYANPVMKASQARTLIFDQGGTALKIFNLSDTLTEFTADRPILTASVSRCGYYAVATESDTYTSSVAVFNRNDEKIYEWFSATDYITSVLPSPDGKKLAVATVNASDGVLKSKLSVFKFDSANAVFSVEFSDTSVYDIKPLSSGFVVFSSRGCSYYKWKNYEQKDFLSDYSPSLSSLTPKGLTVAFSRTSNKSDNHILVISQKGEQLASFDYTGIISDIAFYDNRIYCIGDGKAVILDRDGQLISSAECEINAEHISVIGSRSVAVTAASGISEITFS